MHTQTDLDKVAIKFALAGMQPKYQNSKIKSIFGGAAMLFFAVVLHIVFSSMVG